MLLMQHGNSKTSGLAAAAKQFTFLTNIISAHFCAPWMACVLLWFRVSTSVPGLTRAVLFLLVPEKQCCTTTCY